MQLPKSLIESLNSCKGFDQKAFEEIHENGEQITSIRINPYKNSNSQYPIPKSQKIPWSTNGYYLNERPSFTLDPLFHAGAYYVQEASSMFLEEVIKKSVDVSQPLKVLDLCAAPGGKSTLLQSILSSRSLLISNEVIKTRVNVLSENITKWGYANVIVINNDPAHFKKLPGYFDVIVVDAPCSGSGLFRKDKNAIEEWSEQNVQLCCQRQQRILSDILPSLKEEGVLIYSTCSYSFGENEIIADWLMNNHDLSSIKIKTEENWNIVETISPEKKAYGYRFYPYLLKGEGFFIAAFRNKSTTDCSHSPVGRLQATGRKILKATVNEQKIIEKYLINPSNFFYIKNNNEIIALPNFMYDDLQNLQSALYIKKAGVLLGTVMKNELIPSHDLALSNFIHPDVEFIAIDKNIALKYLRREEIKIDTDKKGWVLLKYQNLPLGWVKILANRINNYYPNTWRILKN